MFSRLWTPHFVAIKKSSLTRARPGEGPFLASWLFGLLTCFCFWHLRSVKRESLGCDQSGSHPSQKTRRMGQPLCGCVGGRVGQPPQAEPSWIGIDRPIVILSEAKDLLFAAASTSPNLYSTVWVKEAELGIKLLLPLYVAVMLCVPEASVLIVNLATPPFTPTVFSNVVPS